MGEGYPLSFDNVDPHSGGVEQEVYDMIVKQVHLVDVEQTTIGGCKNMP